MKWLQCLFASLACIGMAPYVAHAESTREVLGKEPALAFVDHLPSYHPRQQVSGTLTIWGHGSFKRDFMGQLLDAWISEFAKQQPKVRFENRMYGTASAIAALYTGTGNLAILGEEISPAAARAFRRTKGYAPTKIEVATGSLDVNFYDYAHMVFVHRDNHLKGLTLAQLRSVFGEQGAMADIRDWSQLGQPGGRIQPYGWKTDVDFGLFFRERVLADSHRWNGAIREYEHMQRADGTQYDHGQRILDALAEDPNGIAISNTRYARAEVRDLPLAWTAKGPFVRASPATLINRSYPLVRIVPAYVDVPPGKKMGEVQREFLRFLLSREGQRILIDHSGYLPLGRRFISRGQEKLK